MYVPTVLVVQCYLTQFEVTYFVCALAGGDQLPATVLRGGGASPVQGRLPLADPPHP